MKQSLRVYRCECCGRYIAQCTGGYLTAEEILSLGVKSVGDGQYEFINQEKGEEFYNYLGQGKHEFTRRISD